MTDAEGDAEMPRRRVDMRDESPGKPSTLAPQIHSASRRLGVFLSVSLLMCCVARQDRKSTRLNSSHTVISYAVFCLKKKNQYSILHQFRILTIMTTTTGL